MRKEARELEGSARAALQQLAQRRSSAPEVWRARLALAFYQGAGYRQISARFGCGQATVARWVGRFRAAGVAGLQSRPHARGTGPRQRLLQLYLPAAVHQAPAPWAGPRPTGPCGRCSSTASSRPASVPVWRVSAER